MTGKWLWAQMKCKSDNHRAADRRIEKCKRGQGEARVGQLTQSFPRYEQTCSNRTAILKNNNSDIRPARRKLSDLIAYDEL